MRNPRLTGQKVPVYKVCLDDGSEFRATANHEVYMLHGITKQVVDLMPGDRVRILTTIKATLEEKLKIVGRNTNYRWLISGGGGFSRTKSEHRLIAAHFANRPLTNGEVVHHKDYNGLNNNPLNLQIMSKEAHDLFHIQDMIGDKNPMRRAALEWSAEKWKQYSQHMSEAKSGPDNGRWSGITDDELRQHALILTKQLGVRFSDKDWRKYANDNGLVEQFSKWRNDHLGGIIGLAKWAALECGIEHVDLDPRTTKFYLRMLSEGYNCHLKEKEVWICKCCEVCGKSFDIRAVRREHGICSQECHAVYMADRNRNSDVGRRAIDGMKAFYQEKKRANANAMVEVFLDLKTQFGREPLLKELRQACKVRNLAYRIGVPSFFASYDELKEYASNYNHRVVSVKYDGLDDVYNGTVDEFHNYAIGCWSHTTAKGKNAQVCVITANCGEQVLEPGGACVLGSLLLHQFVTDPFAPQAKFDYGLFHEMVRRAVRHLDNVVELNLGRHALEEQEEAAHSGRRIGLGITGLADMLAALGIRYDSPEAIQVVDDVMYAKRRAEYQASIDLAKERGAFPLFDPEKHYERGFCATLEDDIKEAGRKYGQRNVAISTVAPAGSLSVIAQCSSGIEPIFALHYKRYIELGTKRKEFSVRHQGLSRLIEVTGSEEVPRHWVTAHGIDYHFRISLQGVVQKHTDASISSTINLSKDVDAETVGEIYLEAWKTGLKGVTVYREGSREGILVTDEFARQAGVPIDTIVYEARAEAGDKFYIPISYENGDVRKPYQVFLINYKTSENDRFVKIGNDLVRMLREQGVNEKRIQKYIDRSNTQLSKVTRFISLSMKTGCFAEAVAILGEHGTVGTLSAELYKILSRSLVIKNSICRGCGSSNVRMEEGCMHCLDCGWSGCG
jgi:ribonucleotide reductase alpha subunit